MTKNLNEIQGFDLGSIFSPSNPVFSGGFGLAVLAAGAQILRQGSKIGIQFLKRNFLVTLEVTSKDRSYPWVLNWIVSKGTRTQHLSVETSFKPSVGNTTNMKFDLVPGPGQHLLFYKGTPLIVQRIREQQMVDLNSGKPWEKVIFTGFGKNTKTFNSILNEAYELTLKQDEGKTIIFTNWGAEWRQFGQPRAKRPLHSVILDHGISEKLLFDVEEWMNSSKWYSDRGIPYRRGYLLHGPPGSGKSSFIMSLAGKLNYNICILNLSERGLTDERLAIAMSNIPPQSLVLLEDIDAAFPNRENTSVENKASNYYPGSDVTFSGLLNVLDGVASSEERLVFMTTNYIDRLDPALIRPGRVDFVQLIDDASDYQVSEIFGRFYPLEAEEKKDLFVQTLRGKIKKISMAMLQGYLLRFKNSPELAIENISKLAQDEETRLNSHLHHSHIPTKNIQSPQKKRALTIEEIDRMYFNPQEGWDKDIKEI